MFSVHTIFQNICKSEKVQIPPVVEVAVLQFHERWQLPELSSSFFFFCCNAISRIISSCVVSLVNFRGSYQQFWDFSGNFIFPHPLLLPFLLPLVPHEVEEEKGVLVRVCQVADRCLRNRPVHLNLQTKLEPFKSTKWGNLPWCPAWWGCCWAVSTPCGRAHTCTCILPDPGDTLISCFKLIVAVS